MHEYDKIWTWVEEWNHQSSYHYNQCGYCKVCQFSQNRLCSLKYTFQTLVQNLLFFWYSHEKFELKDLLTISMLSTEWKGNLPFIQVEHSHRKLTLLLFNPNNSAYFSLLHFLWTAELQFLKNTCVSPLLFLLSYTLHYWELLWIPKGIIILNFIFSFVIFMQFDQLNICQLKETKQVYL